MITHLFFADDGILFARAKLEEVARIKEILKVYKGASSEMVNFEKTEMSYSRNVCESVRVNIRDYLGVCSVPNHSMYLGLPVVLGKSKRDIFVMVVENVWKKVKG